MMPEDEVVIIQNKQTLPNQQILCGEKSNYQMK